MTKPQDELLTVLRDLHSKAKDKQTTTGKILNTLLDIESEVVAPNIECENCKYILTILAPVVIRELLVYDHYDSETATIFIDGVLKTLLNVLPSSIRKVSWL